MATVQTPVSDMLVTVKYREVQRGMAAEMHGDQAAARRHFLAAGHLELVLAGDYEQNGDHDLAFRSRLSAGSCFWRGGEIERARKQFDALIADDPDRAGEVRDVLEDLERSHPAK
jgi:hypothetical protein